MSCPMPISCSHYCALFRSVAFLGSGILIKLLNFVVFPVVFVHLYAWQVDILINVNVNCEIMKWNEHQQQIANKLIICITEKKSVACTAPFASQNQKLIKILKFFCLWQCQLLFLFIMYNGLIFDEKCVFLYFNCIFFLHRKRFD